MSGNYNVTVKGRLGEEFAELEKCNGWILNILKKDDEDTGDENVNQKVFA